MPKTRIRHGIAVIAVSACLVFSVESAVASEYQLPEKAAQWKAVGFAQLTAELVDDSDGLDFGADRIRAGLAYDSTQLFGKLLLDFNVNNGGQRVGATLPNMIKDAYVGWRANSQWSGRFGQFKSPVGMDFNTSGTALDIAKRGLEKPLVFERNIGAMVSGRHLLSGFGIDLGVFNPADRSAAVDQKNSAQSEANAYAMRLLFDHGNFHAELSGGISDDAGGVGTDNYSVADLGLAWKGKQLTLKGEVIRGDGILGIAGRQETVAFAHMGYRYAQQWEAVARHYAARSKVIGSAVTNLGNTYIGVNFWPKISGKTAIRMQLNYVLASGQEQQYTGLGGFKKDAVLFQLLVKSK